MNNKGVTIFEILVVIIIIGIISTISIPSMAVIYSNTQKDTVLNTAINIERAAKNYCRQDNYLSCPPGTELGYNELSPFLISVDTSYELQVTVGGGLRYFFVYYAKAGSYSFPYTNTGHSIYSTIGGASYLGAVATTSSREHVNIPTEGDIFDAPEWAPNTFAPGDFFTYDDKLWQVRYDGWSSTPPEGSALFPYGPYQEITIYYREYNTYLTGDSVIHNDATYVALHGGMSGIEPGTAFFWQEQTYLYRPFNIYYTGEIITHNGAQYQALHDGMSGIEPGTAWGWQELTDEWRFYNTYQLGDEVIHEDKTYVALYYSQGQEPGLSPAWSEVIDLGEYGTWNAFQNYPSGTYIVHNNALFMARNYASAGQEPGLLTSPWQEITQEWRFFNVYVAGNIVLYNGLFYEARWWNQNAIPGENSVWLLTD